MWALTNKTPYAAERTWVRDKDGKHHWIVVVKATFEFTPEGKLRLADEQLPPLHEPEYLYYPRGNPAKLGPAGFGALAGYWSPRLERGGTYDQNWSSNKKPLLPDDYDEATLLCAPADALGQFC